MGSLVSTTATVAHCLAAQPPAHQPHGPHHHTPDREQPRPHKVPRVVGQHQSPPQHVGTAQHGSSNVRCGVSRDEHSEVERAEVEHRERWGEQEQKSLSQ